ncbi:nitronate monooxygenase [Psychrobacillus sp. FSL W7-1493]|uniref:NAD(P)H-dependent flavin oxidoreductase n=1 Tax=Psychrobacillus sp. FSL W7-1493 TaxID=2921552 RepID=UPI0030F8AD23
MIGNNFLKALDLKFPIIQAPMAGGITTPVLVSEVSNQGALGMIGAGYLKPDQLRMQINQVKALTNANYGVNLFVPEHFELNEDQVEKSKQLIDNYELLLNHKMKEPDLPTKEIEKQTYEELLKIVIEERVAACSFTFGIPSKKTIENLKQNGIMTIGTATTVPEAIAIEQAGMDAVVVQGSEAGGHRGNFLVDSPNSMIGLMALIPQVADQVSIPVIAAGGIMDGRGLSAALCLGADAVQMGTAFLTCKESGAHLVHRQAVLQAKSEDIVSTKAFSGKEARGIENRFMKEMHVHENKLPPFPVQNALTQNLRKAATQQKNADFMSLWSGQSPTLAREETVEQLVRRVVNEANLILNK